MLSELTEAELQLFGFIRNRGCFIRFIEPGPEISMSKEVHSQQGHEIRKGPVKLGTKLKEPKNQHGNQCCPNLDLDGIGTGAHKGLDFQVLLQSFKEDLDLPTLFVNASNSRCPQFQVIRQEYQDLLGLRVIDFDPSKRVRAFFDGLGTSQFDHFIFEDVTVLGDLPLANDFIQSIVLHAGDNLDPLGSPSAKQGVVVIPSVIDDDGSRIETKLTSHLDV
jgi:hypothetical protein